MTTMCKNTKNILEDVAVTICPSARGWVRPCTSQVMRSYHEVQCSRFQLLFSTLLNEKLLIILTKYGMFENIGGFRKQWIEGSKI